MADNKTDYDENPTQSQTLLFSVIPCHRDNTIDLSRPCATIVQAAIHVCFFEGALYPRKYNHHFRYTSHTRNCTGLVPYP